jgi:hypothetical protein
VKAILEDFPEFCHALGYFFLGVFLGVVAVSLFF